MSDVSGEYCPEEVVRRSGLILDALEDRRAHIDELFALITLTAHFGCTLGVSKNTIVTQIMQIYDAYQKNHKYTKRIKMNDTLIRCPKEVAEISKRLMKALDGYEAYPGSEILAFLLLAVGASCSIGVAKNSFMESASELYDTWDEKFSDLDE